MLTATAGRSGPRTTVWLHITSTPSSLRRALLIWSRRRDTKPSVFRRLRPVCAVAAELAGQIRKSWFLRQAQDSLLDSSAANGPLARDHNVSPSSRQAAIQPLLQWSYRRNLARQRWRV